tara:strand:+ start:3171 stop:3743 length:573 start_codon:yes stop_codon:yes gene_type:complete
MINIKKKILFLIIMTASLTMLNANYNQRLILKNESAESIDEYIINSTDLILIKCKNKKFLNPKYLVGQFVKTENNFILFENKTLGEKSLESVHKDNIDVLYVGNVRTWKDLHRKWALYLSALLIPGSIKMGNSPYVTEGLEGAPAAVVAWCFFSMVSYCTYAPIFSYIDFNVRKENATEFVIGENQWVIN